MLHNFEEYEQNNDNEGAKIGVGISSGRVVISSADTAMGRELRVVGSTTWLASRLENLALPGTALISQETRQLVENLIVCIPLGPTTIKGVPKKLSIFQLVERATLTRFQALTLKGLNPFVGRSDLLASLVDESKNVSNDNSASLIIEGDPGVGKSRLAYELIEIIKNRFTVIEISGIAHVRSPLVGD